MSENTYSIIAKQIRQMRRSQVEPEAVFIAERLYMELDCPKKIAGVPVEVDNDIPMDWMVR